MPSRTQGPPGADGLGPYRSRRDFTRTPEPPAAPVPPGDTPPPRPPSGDAPPAGTPTDDTVAGPGTGTPAHGGRRFVVQRHRARRLHYDFRLEIAGVLVSWAVPKGPSLDPAVRRAAFRVEDHPIEYVGFEGVIPAGEYGGGDVIVWDTGTWDLPDGTGPPDPGQALQAGELHLDLHGTKLRGRFVLVRTGRDGAAREEWLLLHKRDVFAVPGWDPEDHPHSVLSGRTNEQVKADPGRMWRPELPAEEAEQPARPGVVTTSDRSAAAGPLPRTGAADGARPPDGSTDPAAPAVSEEELEQLDAMGSAGRWHVFGRDLRVTNLDKVLFPARPGQPPVTKRELLRYSALIAPTVLPHLAHRALNMHRFPNGVTSNGFWHKELPGHAPDWLPRWTDPAAETGETRTYLVVDEPAALVWAANFAAVEWHARTSEIDRPRQPTYALIDLDPGTRTSWPDLLVLARLHRAALEHLGVTGCPVVTGRRGIQIWIPILPGPDFDTTRAWVERVSRTVGAVVPDLVSWKWQVAERGGLARLDYTQNAINKTLVSPYSPRAAAGAPVSTPIAWDELDDPDLASHAFTIRTVLPRIAERGDPFGEVLRHRQQLPALR